MVLVTTRLNERGLRHASQVQCGECGNTVFIELAPGSRIAVVCLNPDRWSDRVADIYSRFHEWSLSLEAAPPA